MAFITTSITTRFKIRSLTILSTLAIILTLATGFVTAETPDRPFGDVQILSTVPFPPGFPEGIAVNGDKVYVAGPASFDTAGTPGSTRCSAPTVCA